MSCTSAFSRIRVLAGILMVVVIMAGCDLGVTDPGQIDDTDLDDPGAITPLVKGTEMRLIEAEVSLVQNQNMNEAVNKINEVRELHGLDAHDPADYDLNSAWELLMKEKGIELWLERRRIADLRRWSGTTGSVP